MFRTFAFAVALFVSVGFLVPTQTDLVTAKLGLESKNNKKLRKFSKAWWRWYKKQQRKKRAILARKRALRAKQTLLERKRLLGAKRASNKPENK